jgi:hypothetical protein
MKTKFTTLEMKAKKLHRRTGSATSASTYSTSAGLAALLPTSQMRSTSSHPNLLTLKDDVETRQRSKSSSLLMHGIVSQQSISLPSSPVSQSHNDPSLLTSPLQHTTGEATTPPNIAGIALQITLSPTSTSVHPHPNPNPSTDQSSSSAPHTKSEPTPEPTLEPTPDPTYPTPTLTPAHTAAHTPALTIHADPTLSNPHSAKSPPIQIPMSSHLAPSSSANPISISPINPVSISPIGHDLAHATNSSDDTLSEVSQHDNSSVVEGEGDEWDVDWLLEDSEERKDDDTVLYTEIEGHIDLQGGLSQFVQFLSTAKQDWACRYMDRVLREDVGPCLRLRTQEDRAYKKLLEAVWHNRIFVEHLPATVNEVCAGCGAENTCQWRVRIGSSHEFKSMGDLCRERIVRTCDFYMYLRNLRQGLVKKTLPNIYKEFLKLRLMMNFARLCAG